MPYEEGEFQVSYYGSHKSTRPVIITTNSAFKEATRNYQLGPNDQTVITKFEIHEMKKPDHKGLKIVFFHKVMYREFEKSENRFVDAPQWRSGDSMALPLQP